MGAFILENPRGGTGALRSCSPCVLNEGKEPAEARFDQANDAVIARRVLLELVPYYVPLKPADNGQEDETTPSEVTFSWKDVLKAVLRLRQEDKFSEGNEGTLPVGQLGDRRGKPVLPIGTSHTARSNQRAPQTKGTIASYARITLLREQTVM